MGDRRFVLTDGKEGGDARLGELGIRRCRGCVRCLTEHPGECEIEDGFTPLIAEILGSETLVVSMSPERGRVPDRVRKAVERLSNILDAYTDCGGNVPLPIDSVGLRRIEFECRGNFADRMESEMTGALRKGPVSDVIFKETEEN
ncbi:MAG: hypothetical protein Q4Q62_03135 [Thermoplasmata archaeon]|nr:hypothetical protein [Thermoplasmata archaeon]